MPGMEYVASRTQRNPLRIVLFPLWRVAQDALICLLLWRKSRRTTDRWTAHHFAGVAGPSISGAFILPPVGHMYLMSPPLEL